MIGLLTDREIDDLLRTSRLGRIACTANDRPYLIPISYAYDGEDIYCSSVYGRKIQVMREQPLVCFEVEAIENESSWKCVIAEAVYEELNDRNEREAAMAQLAPADSRFVPRSMDASARLVVFRLRVTSTSGRFESRDA
jgi:nitroimidazol reductase NimA-like FMN-containing flavoprotein (pyridoxamine 5'-phosphate oxidase superfamily)